MDKRLRKFLENNVVNTCKNSKSTNPFMFCEFGCQESEGCFMYDLYMLMNKVSTERRSYKRMFMREQAKRRELQKELGYKVSEKREDNDIDDQADSED